MNIRRVFMKKRLLILPLLAGLALASCEMPWSKKDETPGDTPSGETASVVSVDITGAKTSLALGATMQLGVNVTVTGSAAKTVSWSTSASAKATVSNSGLVTAKGLGEVTITATSTVDTTKSASITFTVVKPTWDSTTQGLFEEYFEEAPPAFIVPSGLTWTDEYFEDYECISAEGSGNKVSQVVANILATGDYTDKGTDSQGGHNFSATCKDDADSDWLIQVYYDSSITVIDVYKEPKEYDSWPTEVINSHIEELGFTSCALPVYESVEDLAYSCYFAESESGEKVLVVNVCGEPIEEEPKITAEDYVALLDSDLYKVIEIEGGYQLQAKDATHTIFVYDQDYAFDFDEDFNFVIYFFDGFQIFVAPYQADYSLAINESYSLLGVGDTLDLTLVKGDDVPSTAAFTYTSSEPTVATVNENGHVEALAKGTTTITVAYADKSTASAVIYVEDTVPTAFSAEQLAEFAKIHGEGVVTAPFNKYFETVKYSDEGILEITGKAVSHSIIESFYDEMISAGWSDIYQEEYEKAVEDEYYETVEEAREEVFNMEGQYSFEKAFVANETEYLVNASLYATEYDEEEEADVLALDGNIRLDIFDPYIYSYATALTELNTALTALGYETLPTFPEDLPAKRFGITGDGSGVSFIAYETVVDLTLLKTALEAKGFTCTLREEPATETSEAYSYLECSALEGEFVMYATFSEGTLEMYVPKKASGGWAASEEDLYDGAEICLFAGGYGLGAFDKSYFTAVNAIDDENYYDPDADGLLHLFLEKDGDVWHLKDEDGNYYGDNGNKAIVSSKTPEGTGKTSFDWTVSFDEDEYATLSCNSFDLYFNSTSPRFKTYASGMSSGETYYIYIYKN